jgi:hypothetical protein
MGLFDNIRCKYKLPMPDDLMELRDFKFNEEVFQTKDLECAMDFYVIEEDGTLWHEEYDTEDRSNPNAKGFERFIGCATKVNQRMVRMRDYTGKILLYSFITFSERSTLNLKNDYWVEWSLVFVDGVVKTAKLERFYGTDNTEQRKRNAEMHEEFRKHKELHSCWYMRYGYHYYDRLIHYVFTQWRKLCNKLPSYKIERFLRPL